MLSSRLPKHTDVQIAAVRLFLLQKRDEKQQQIRNSLVIVPPKPNRNVTFLMFEVSLDDESAHEGFPVQGSFIGLSVLVPLF